MSGCILQWPCKYETLDEYDTFNSSRAWVNYWWIETFSSENERWTQANRETPLCTKRREDDFQRPEIHHALVIDWFKLFDCEMMKAVMRSTFKHTQSQSASEKISTVKKRERERRMIKNCNFCKSLQLDKNIRHFAIIFCMIFSLWAFFMCVKLFVHVKRKKYLQALYSIHHE